jgi:hypothetical protein
MKKMTKMIMRKMTPRNRRKIWMVKVKTASKTATQLPKQVAQM